MLRFALGFPLLLLFVSSFVSQDLDEFHKKIQTAVGERNHLIAIAELQKLKAEQPGVFEANNYNYLLARLADRAGDTATAAANYQAVAVGDSVLKEYALWHLAQIVRATGNLLLEQTYLQQIIAFSPDSLLAVPARFRLTRSFFESGNYPQVIKLLNEPRPTAQSETDKRKNQQTARQDAVLLAEAYVKTGDSAKAREVYTRLITELTNPGQPDDFALAAVKGLDRLEVGAEEFGRKVPNLSDYEHLRRASIYQFNRDFADARLHYAAIIENYSASGIAPDAMFQTGRGYIQQGKFAEAVEWFERVQERFPEHPVSKDALLQAASAYARMGRNREAVTRYQRYIETYKDDERLDRAYLNIIDALRDNREEIEALQWTARTQEAFKGRLPEALALFAEARIHLSRTDWQNALASLEKLRQMPDLGGAAVPGGANSAEVTFLRGLALENLRRYPEAIEAYLSIPDGRSEYYGGLATERVRLLAGDGVAKLSVEAKLASLNAGPGDKDAQRRNLQAALRLTESAEERSRLLEELRKLYNELPAYRTTLDLKFLKLGRQQVLRRKQAFDPADRHKAIADELLFLGVFDEAGPETESAYKKGGNPVTNSSKTDFDYTIAAIFNRGDRADRAAAFIEPQWKMPMDFQPELIPPKVADMLYPAPYSDLLIKYAPQRGVDPRFLLSIMRQESRFRADVKSNAAARGLMQFISSTADQIATEVGRSDFRQDDLYDPSTAILFGSQYVGNLFKIFTRQPAAVAASYNGGEDNVKRWVNRSRSDDPARYVPEIAFSQSKDYVYRVMANYRLYQSLYSENLKRR